MKNTKPRSGALRKLSRIKTDACSYYRFLLRIRLQHRPRLLSALRRFSIALVRSQEFRGVRNVYFFIIRTADGNINLSTIQQRQPFIGGYTIN